MTPNLRFPEDHWLHWESPYEWRYFWGRLDDGKFFHYVEFVRRNPEWEYERRFRHWSVDGEFHEDERSYLRMFRFKTQSPTFEVELFPYSKVVVHQSVKSIYYSIPILKGTTLCGDTREVIAWFDHQWLRRGEQVGHNWDGVMLQLDSGMCICAWDTPDERICDVSWGDNILKANFILENKHFFVYETGMYLTLEPLKEEIIFRPTYGRPYSETPVEVTAKGGVIGYGIRERTYKEEKI